MKRKILFVDDDLFSRKVFKFLFEKDYEVSIYENPSQVLEALEKFTFDLFVIDIALGTRTDGLEIIRKIRENERYKNTPVFCLTAHVRSKDENDALNAGADKFIRKPINNNDLKAIIDEALS
ncbi:MAG: response regulator [Melioribacteraceae bacterium]|nr:response regulator [Melioribacteraceae bacterium]MCO6472774.1 response regulator [Melioribacteraceae bacterium]MDD3558549.1 response regulator [Melioribacteraceae bacterium]